MILVHNHPSGDPSPSPDDLHLTAETIAAGRLLDIDVLDHIVLGNGAWVSRRDRGVSFDGRPDGRTMTEFARALAENAFDRFAREPIVSFIEQVRYLALTDSDALPRVLHRQRRAKE